jgi:hypothetical protein
VTPIARATLFASLIAFAPMAFQNSARAASAGYCPGGAGHRVAHAVPAALEPSVAETFGIGVDQVRAGAVVRCVGSQLRACWVGANLDCGKADTRRRLVGATAFCRDNPGAAVVPMVATGHDTIYDWRCVRARAVAGKVVRAVDPAGYIQENWKAVK